MQRITPILLAFFGLLSSALAQRDNLTIAVAANLLPPMRQIEELYEKEFQSSLTLIVASSGKLTSQIINGAPYDIFISADMKYPERIYDEEHAQQPPKVLLRGRLYFWTVKPDAATIEEGLKDAAAIAIAQPELAPYGQQTRQWLESHELWGQLQDRIVYAENVSQVNQYITTGAVDAAFTSNSARYTDALRSTGTWMEVPDTESLAHGIVLLRNAEATEFSIDQFLEFIISPIAQEVFQDFGYEIP